jgi:hypothetical protein
MEELSIRVAERHAHNERYAIRAPGASGRAGPRGFRIYPRLLARCDRGAVRREHVGALLLLAAFLLVACAPFAWALGRPPALCGIVGDHGVILAGVGAVLILVVLGEHLLIEYSRLARLSNKVSFAARLEDGFARSQQLSAVHDDCLTGDPGSQRRGQE